MKLFPCAHATHPQWAMAAGLVLAQLRARMALADHADAPTLGLLYITDHFAGAAQDILDHLMAQLPQVTDWVGTVGVGIAAGGVEYFDEPAIAVLLCDLPPHRYRVFSGVAPLAAGAGFIPNTALLHADGGTPDLGELIADIVRIAPAPLARAEGEPQEAPADFPVVELAESGVPLVLAIRTDDDAPVPAVLPSHQPPFLRGRWGPLSRRLPARAERRVGRPPECERPRFPRPFSERLWQRRPCL